VEHDDDRHLFCEAEARGAVALAFARREQSFFPEWFKELTEIVDVTENGENVRPGLSPTVSASHREDALDLRALTVALAWEATAHVPHARL
jgi:hypothetical protein